jgi:hypothetical protein
MESIKEAAMLAPLNRRSENVIVEAIIVLKLTLRNVERQIFAANLMVAADDAALEHAPETLNRVGVNRADDVLPGAMPDGLVCVARRMGGAKRYPSCSGRRRWVSRRAQPILRSRLAGCLICPTGKSLNFLSSPICKNIFLRT